MGRPKEHDEQTRAALLRTAEVLLADEGMDAISVRRVAREVGISTRAIYSVFGDKDGLLHALYRQSFRSLVDTIASVPEEKDPGSGLVRLGVDGFRRYALDHPNLFRLVFEQSIAAARRSPEDYAVALDALDRLRSRVQRCADAGMIPQDSIDVVASAFHALCQGLASMELSDRLPLPRGSADPRVVWDQALSALVAGFNPTALRSSGV